ncbi:hypothetical protein BD769DRAFT_1395807 [Suillus cothurnatus]|nr:hypothetical protein BD769DRAFT_1395807 [Suillus cothurnatus]
MTWQNILDKLKKAALTISNQGPASESILGVKHLTLQHSTDHWEELHAPIHAIFSWGQEGVLELCQKAPQSPAHGNQSEPLHLHTNPSRTTGTPSPARPDTQRKEYIKISEGSDKEDEESTDGLEGHDTDDEHIKLDSGDHWTLQKLKSGKNFNKLPQQCQYDLSKYNRHLQRCPWATGSRLKSKTKKEYIPMKPITLFFTSSVKKSSETIKQKSPQSIPPLTVAQADGANIDMSMACLGRADGAYALLAKNAVSGDMGGVGSITSWVEIAKGLFPYKYGVNMHTSITKFSQEELAILGQELLSRWHWFIENGCDAGSCIIRSVTCTRHFVPDSDGKASKRDKADAQLSETDQNKVKKRQVTNMSLILVQTCSTQLKEYLKDPQVHRAYQLLENDDYGQVFLELFKHTNEHSLFVKIAEALANKVGQTHSDNPNAKYGAHYDSEVMNFFIAMCGYGSQSAVQYGLLSQVIGGVCQRRLRHHMDSPYLSPHNIGHLVNNIAHRGHQGVPIVLAMDCTVVKGQLAHCTMFGSHILGGMKPLSEVEVNTCEDIEWIIKEVIDENSLASQVCVLIGKTPLPGSRPIPLLVTTSQGKETAEDNARTLLDCLSLCQRAGLAVISCGSDGTSSEVGAHDIIHNSASEHLTFSIEKFGFIFSIPIFPTGPLVTVPNPSHIQKVLWNNKQSGTHLLSVGNHCLTHQTLVVLCKEPNSGMVKKDVENTDKQDDGSIQKPYHLAFVVHFICGELFDAYFKRDLSHAERYYPTVPFLPWQHGSLPLEKIFGIAHEFLTNFSYVEFLGILGVHERKEKSSGYVYDTTLERLSHEDLKKLTDIPSLLQMEDIVNIAWEDVVAIFNDALGVSNISPLPLVFTASRTETKRLKQARKWKARCEDESGSEDDDDDDLENATPLCLAAAQAENITAVVHLRKSHDRNSGVLSKKLFEQKAKYSHYKLKNLARVTMQLNSAAGLDTSDGNGVFFGVIDSETFLTYEFAATHIEHWMATKANPTCDDGAGSSSVSIGNWAIAKQLIAAVPRLEDNLIGSYVVMQRSQPEGHYIGQVVSAAVFLLACTDLNSRTSKTHPEESENSFWHYSKSTGHLWTLASIKELVYNLGTSALSVSDGRYHTLKLWETAGMVTVCDIIALQFTVRPCKKQNHGVSFEDTTREQQEEDTLSKSSQELTRYLPRSRKVIDHVLKDWQEVLSLCSCVVATLIQYKTLKYCAMSLTSRLSKVMQCLQDNGLSTSTFVSSILKSSHVEHQDAKISLTSNAIAPHLWNLMMALLDSRDNHQCKMPSPLAVGLQMAGVVEQQEMDLGEFGGDSIGLTGLGDDDSDDESEEAFERHPKKRQHCAAERNEALLVVGWMGFFMKSTCVPEKVVEVLAHAGLSISLSSIHNAVMSVSKEISSKIRSEVHTL